MNRFAVSAAVLPFLLGMVTGCGDSGDADSAEQASGASAGPTAGLVPASELEDPTEGFGVRAEVVTIDLRTDEVTGRTLQTTVRLTQTGDAGARVHEVRLACGDELVEGSNSYLPDTGEEYPTGPINIGTEPIEIESPAEGVDSDSLAPECGDDLSDAWVVVILDGTAEDDYDLDLSKPGDGAPWEDFGNTYGVLPVAVDVAAEVGA